MSDALVRLIETAGNPRVLVVGDLMLDRYVWGETRRISGEWSIPILEVVTEESRPGGAGNVVSDLARLGAQVVSPKDDWTVAFGPAPVAPRLGNLPGSSPAPIIHLTSGIPMVRIRRLMPDRLWTAAI